MSQYDAIVVGSGPNGLSAAIELARAGLSVLVREANESIGGGARSRELTLPGFLHDVCSAIHPLAIASPFFRSLPLAKHGLEWIQPPLPLVHPLDDGPPAILERGVEERGVEATAAALNPDSSAYRRLMGPLVRHWEPLFAEIMGPPLHVPSSPIALARFGVRALWPAAALTKAAFRGGRARALFDGLAAHSLVALEKPGTSAIGLVLAASAHAVGWPLPCGGSQQITEALASYFRSLGGTIETNAPVESLESMPPARAVLLDVTVRQAVQVASKRLPRQYLRTLSRFHLWTGCVQDRLGVVWPYSMEGPGVRAHGDAPPWWRGGRDRGGRKGHLEWRVRGKAIRVAGPAKPLRRGESTRGAPHWLGLLPCSQWIDPGYVCDDRGPSRALCPGLSRFGDGARHKKHRTAGAIECKSGRRRHCRRRQQSLAVDRPSCPGLRSI
jgi:phytoene dehydrogenase-like protein